MKDRYKFLLRLFSPVIVTFLVYGSILFFLYQQGYSPSLFIRAGGHFVDASVPINLIPSHIGYDGQFYYGLSVDPIFDQNPSNGITLDYPHYRQQRILYPLIVHILSLGNQSIIPMMMIVLNLISVGFIAFLGACLSVQYGKNPWFGLLFSFFPGFFVSYTLDLTEIVAAVFLLAALVTINKKSLLSVILLSLAILSRETTLLFALAVLFTSFLQKWKRWYFYLIPPAVYAVWQCILYIKWGLNDGIPLGNLNFPFIGISSFIISSINKGQVIEIVSTSLVCMFLAAIFVGVIKKKPPMYIMIASLLYSLLFLSLSNYVWIDFQAYIRGFYELFILGITIFLTPKVIHLSSTSL